MGRIRLFLFCLCFAHGAEDPAGVRGVLAEQELAWNRGDLEAFVETYENSPSITFLGKALSHGRDQVLERYRKNYGTREKMGRLRFEVLEIRELGPEHAMVIGKFFLTRTPAGGGDASGHFTLVLRKGSKGWKIIHDHTS